MAESLAFRIPGRHLAAALVVSGRQAIAADWRGSALGRWMAHRPRPTAFSDTPREIRPISIPTGRQVLDGVFELAGESLSIGAGGEVWDRPCPTRAFALALHSFEWLPHLMATAPAGPREALRLVLAWRRHFGVWNQFSWSDEVLARRAVNLACAGAALAEHASEAETALIAASLARQARLLLGAGDPASRAHRAIAAAIAGAALNGDAGRRLLGEGLRRLPRLLPHALDPDGGHRSRRADHALALLLDMMILDEALSRRGRATPDVVLRAMDQLSEAVRFFTLPDGGLSTQQGGAPSAPALVAAAARDAVEVGPHPVRCNGYHRMNGSALEAIVDCAPPAAGPWSTSAAAQPMGLEVLVVGRRLITASVGRTRTEASALTVGETSSDRILSGFVARVLGPRLVVAAHGISVQRHEGPGAVWLDIDDRGWLRRFGVLHQRRLFLDTVAGELRGEDRLTPTAKAQGPDGRHFVPYTLRFQLEPEVSVLVSQDRRSALLRIAGAQRGWILRNDILDIAVEAGSGSRRPSQQLVLQGQRRADSGARVRWKLGPAEAQTNVDATPSRT